MFNIRNGSAETVTPHSARNAPRSQQRRTNRNATFRAECSTRETSAIPYGQLAKPKVQNCHFQKSTKPPKMHPRWNPGRNATHGTTYGPITRSIARNPTVIATTRLAPTRLGGAGSGTPNQRHAAPMLNASRNPAATFIEDLRLGNE